eukprot:CAMPEP_0197631296 /NCGR_PEP_ID=MMETSP1338-20131121/8506_1 /TAXON_ID=43686 ORGANISM="Pelagodinium beii, Strain RCC1491" /NCGR_SAMPLE_ID=MMETSP1338 /ASSEMBLY_ACC=CAM_ASM_000754 /LENGTH=40 /DNA_ID= /DNA_START= /DNA_END= /DNA_ORIENTATION=
MTGVPGSRRHTIKAIVASNTMHPAAAIFWTMSTFADSLDS